MAIDLKELASDAKYLDAIKQAEQSLAKALEQMRVVAKKNRDLLAKHTECQHTAISLGVGAAFCWVVTVCLLLFDVKTGNTWAFQAAFFCTLGVFAAKGFGRYILPPASKFSAELENEIAQYRKAAQDIEGDGFLVFYAPMFESLSDRKNLLNPSFDPTDEGLSTSSYHRYVLDISRRLADLRDASLIADRLDVDLVPGRVSELASVQEQAGYA